MRNLWRRDWRIDVISIVFLIVVIFFATYLEGRQQLAASRAERQRQAICAILANIPGHVPAEIGNARKVFARSGHPTDCQPVVHPTPRPTVTVTPTPRPAALAPPSLTPAGVTPTPQGRPTPSPSRTTSPQPTPTPRPTPSRAPSPSPSPSPRPTCVHAVITVCT